MATERRAGRNDEDPYSFEQRDGGTGRALSHFCQSWLTGGADFLVGSTRALAEALDDLREVYCKPRNDHDRPEKAPIE